jgi:HK97 family phage prohead protease
MWHLGRSMIFKSGAFDNYLSRRPSIEFWLDHDETKSVGSTIGGDLELHSDNVGLAFRLRLPDTNLGRMVRYLAERREYTGMSVGCRQEHALLSVEFI